MKLSDLRAEVERRAAALSPVLNRFYGVGVIVSAGTGLLAEMANERWVHIPFGLMVPMFFAIGLIIGPLAAITADALWRRAQQRELHKRIMLLARYLNHDSGRKQAR